MAAPRIFPRRRLIIGHSLGQGYFYHFDGMDAVPRDDLIRIEAEMRELIARDLPIRSLSLSYQEAISFFEKHHRPDTLLLLKNRNDPAITVHSCDGSLDLFHGPLVPSTGLLSAFALRDCPPGFLLRYPPSGNPLHMGEYVDNPVLFSIYREYKNWGKILRVGSVGRLDELIREGGIQDFIQVAEALQDKKIAEIADRINAPEGPCAGSADSRPVLVGQDDILEKADDPAPRRGPQPRHDFPGRFLQASWPHAPRRGGQARFRSPRSPRRGAPQRHPGAAAAGGGSAGADLRFPSPARASPEGG